MVAKLLDDNIKELTQRSNKDGDDNQNGNKAMGLYYQNNNFWTCTTLFVHIVALVAWLPNFTHRLYGVKFQKVSRRSKTLDPPGSLRLWHSFRKSVSIYPRFAPGCHPENLPPWHRDITTSPLYSFATFARWIFFLFFTLRNNKQFQRENASRASLKWIYHMVYWSNSPCSTQAKTQTYSPVTYILLYIALVSLVKSDRMPSLLSQPRSIFLPLSLASSLSYHKGTLCLSPRMNRNKRFLKGCWCDDHKNF